MYKRAAINLFPLSSHFPHLAETARAKELLHGNGILTFIKAGGVFTPQLNAWECRTEQGESRGERKV